MSTDHDHKIVPKVDPKQVFKVYDQGNLPSQVAILLNISLAEVLDALEKYRKENAPNDAVKKTI